jgi:hypothetical protein
MNYRQIKAIENKYKQELLKVNDGLNEQSGIYFLTRTDEEGFRYAYIGQAKHVLSRLANHFTGYQHIDLSLKKHGLRSVKNPCGWNVGFLNYPEDMLDAMEQKFIKQYADAGYQLRNKTSGSQGKGKTQIDEYRPTKGYRDGIDQGKKNCSREIAHLFDLHLVVTTKSNPPTVNQKKALDKFNDFLNYYKGTDDERR